MAMKKLYTLDWSEISGYIEVAGYKVPMPKMPPLSEMENYGLPAEKQKFRLTEMPSSLLRRKELSPEEEEFVRNEYHKFDNGVWWLIKGDPLYFTGDYYHFLNYWSVEGGGRPYFYQPQQKLYNLYALLDKDDSCLGTALLKARRMRATEITIHRGYFKIFRYRSINMFMQSKTDETAFNNYMRIVNSHDKMYWFVKPINSGSSKNKDGLYFTYPSKQVTNKSLREMAASGTDQESIYEDPEMGGKILYGPCVATHFDGEKGAYVILNEAFKLEGMSLTKVVSILRQCVTMNSLKTKVGMFHIESTVEELTDKQLAEVIALIEESNPEVRNKNGRTTSGLFLIFMSAAESGEPDEWGMVDPEATMQYIQNTIDDLKSRGKVKEAADERRKMPLSIEDAITPSGEATAFHKEKLQETFDRLNFPGKDEAKQTIRGNFEWEGGVRFSRVVFQQDDNAGRWEVSKLAGPGFEDNNVFPLYGENVPGNIDQFRTGVDPFDHKDTSDGRRSKGAAVTFEKYDELKDGKKFQIETGVKRPIDGGLGFETNQPVCIYLHRHDDPNDFYEDMLMQSIYYGAPLLCESNKPGLMRYFDNEGYGRFIMNRPVETMTRKDKASNKEIEGIAASEVTIGQYFSAISSYVYNYHNAIKFKPLINQLLSMNRNNVTKHDLGVAMGWCLLAVNATLPSYKDRYTEMQQEPTWFQYN